MRSMLLEVRPAFRALLRRPLTAGIIIATLALGLGTNAAVFGMADSLLLNPFPFEHVDELVMFSENAPEDPFPLQTVAPANYLEWRELATSFDGMASFFFRDFNLAGSELPDRVSGTVVSADFFSILRVTPAMGRFVRAEDEQFGNHFQVVLSDGIWKRLFGADPNVVGRVVRLDGQPYTVVGVAPSEFVFPMGSDLWMPLAFDEDAVVDRVNHYLTTFAPLKPDVPFEVAAAEMGTLYESQRTEHEGDGLDRRMVVRRFGDGMVDVGLVPIMGLWQAAAFLILLIACANVANLLLARGAARQRELSIRLAIGASRWRLVRQLLMESVMLAVAATPVALLVAAVTLGGLRSAMPGELTRYVPGWEEMGVDLRLALVTLAAAGLTAMIFGLLPALQASRQAPAETLKEGGRSLGAGHSRSRLRRGLVVAEIALALPLLVATGMSAIGAQRFGSGPQGYEPDGLLQLRLQLPTSDYPDAASRRLFSERILAAATTITGVDEAATTSVLPSGSSNTRRNLEVEGQPLDPGTAPPLVNTRSVSPGYLELLRVPVLEGRSIETRDREGAQPVAVVSRSLAQRHWPDESAIGQRIRLGTTPTEWITVVGVVGDTIDDWFISRNVPTVYAPVDQFPTTLVNLALRTDGDPAALAVGARQAVASVDATLAPFDVGTLWEAIRLRTTGLRLVGTIMGAFGGIALVLATLGIYGVMSFFVAQRRHEIGIRMALGASARDVLVRTASRGGRMAVLGIVIGLGLGVLLARLMESALFGTVAIEPWLFAVIAGLLALVAMVASIIPARQAARVDPVVALRAE